jgi:branched-chain amino acid transport system ATP-binding protein
MPETAHLELRAVHGGYGESPTLRGVSLRANKGETIALLGRNGVGKTTTLRAIVGLLNRREGEILVNGTNIGSLPTHRIAYHGIGYIPEERGIFSTLTVDENLDLLPIVGSARMSLDEIYNHFPNLKERRHSMGTKLSGGEQQMLALARVLRAGANLLLLDEPMEGLAPVIVTRIKDILLDLKKRGTTMLLVEQNFTFARSLADRFYLMLNGQIVEEITAADVDAKRARIEEVLGL